MLVEIHFSLKFWNRTQSFVRLCLQKVRCKRKSQGICVIEAAIMPRSSSAVTPYGSPERHEVCEWVIAEWLAIKQMPQS